MILSHYHDHRDHYKVLYYLFIHYSITKKTKMKSFSPFSTFLLVSFSLLSLFNPKPWKTLRCNRFVGLIHQYGHHIFSLLYPAFQYIILGIYHLSYKKLLPQKSMCNSSCISGRHLAQNTQTSKHKVIILFPLDIDTVTIQSPYSLLSLHFSVNEGKERGMSYRVERNRKAFLLKKRETLKTTTEMTK